MMVRICLLFAIVIAVSASTGCYYAEDYTCVRKNAVKCGHDWCYGDCAVENVKSCDAKVWYKTVCETEDYCKPIEYPCGHDGDDEVGLYCGYNEECVVDKVCKLVGAGKKSSYGSGWHAKSMPGGFFEVCKDVYSCAAVDPWYLDESETEITCTKHYDIVDDYDCKTLWGHDDIFGLGGISKERFFRLNRGFNCGKKLIGKTICVEADIHYKSYSCGGSYCDEGYECATREVCEQVALKKPICGSTPVYNCLKNGSGNSLCGNQICGPHEKCEILSNKICPSGTSIVVPTRTSGSFQPVVPVITQNPAPTVVTPEEPQITTNGPISVATSQSVAVGGRGSRTKADAFTANGGKEATANAAASTDDSSATSDAAATEDTATVSTTSSSGSGEIGLGEADALALGSPP